MVVAVWRVGVEIVVGRRRGVKSINCGGTEDVGGERDEG